MCKFLPTFGRNLPNYTLRLGSSCNFSVAKWQQGDRSLKASYYQSKGAQKYITISGGRAECSTRYFII